ncbi:MAG: polyprenyl synthetase family protein [Actinomycetota bacterium]|nr:polyprenyl synthetase family protein [Actinomycetota bacterium]
MNASVSYDLGDERLNAEVSAGLANVELRLTQAVKSDDDFVSAAARHLVDAGGKRFRPLLAVLAANLGDPAAPGVTDAAVVVELTHLATLYHDDVMDEADTRRGVDTVNARWGNLQAILAGDFLLSRASEIAASLGTEVAGLLARTIGRLCEGQIEELRHTYNAARPEPSYLSSISGKTASLYATAARIGGLVAELDRPIIDALTEYGEAYGMVFQIVDDLLDITATDEQLGKPAGHDMVEGVYTLPVLRTLQAGGVAAVELNALLGKPLDMAEREKALGIVRSNGGFTAAMSVAREWADRAEAACELLPASVATDVLRAAPSALLASL